MRNWIRGILLLVVLFAAATYGFHRSNAAISNTPQQTLHKQASYFIHGQYRFMWQTYSPGFRQWCNYSVWLESMRQRHQGLGANVSTLKISVVKIRMVGIHAFLTYVWLLRGEVVGFTTDDMYVRVGRSWYDARDAQTLCDNRVEAEG